jgi:hypothetical protein
LQIGVIRVRAVDRRHAQPNGQSRECEQQQAKACGQRIVLKERCEPEIAASPQVFSSADLNCAPPHTLAG